MRYVVTAEQMRALDAATIEDIGIPGAVLMETAGRAVARAVQSRVPAGGHVAVCCGAGNNGGDGYVIARCLRAWGVSATVYLAVPPAVVRGDALLHLRALEQVGGRVCALDDEASLMQHAMAIEAADVVVDALFGTGLTRDIEGHFAEVVQVINRSRGARVAVDIPSGLSADSGAVLGCAVAADHTVTMAFEKPALVSAPGFARAGRVQVAEIGIPVDLAIAHGVALGVLEPADAMRALPARTAMDHKATRGHVLLIAGSPGKRGAGRLAARACLRAGAGLVTLAAAGSHVQVPDEVMSAVLDASDSGAVLAQLAALLAGKRAVAIGPGMATGEGGRALVRACLERSEVPVVLDADALNHLGADLSLVAGATATGVLTPHPGEAARLLACTSADIERDRIDAVRRLAQASRAVVVLKGARTLVCDGSAGDDFVTINPTGNAGMATGGSGDVLTGVIAALIASGASPGDAARAGVFVHGRAGDLAAATGATGLIASDIVEALPAALASFGQP